MWKIKTLKTNYSEDVLMYTLPKLLNKYVKARVDPYMCTLHKLQELRMLGL